MNTSPALEKRNMKFQEKKRENRIPVCRSDKVFYFFLSILVAMLVVLFGYPLYYVVMASFSDPYVISNGAVLLHPIGFTLDGYANIIQNGDIWTGYRNSIIYTLIGTPLSVLMTSAAAFAFSRNDMPFKRVLMPLYMFTMYFGGGLIPLFLVVRSLGLINNPAVVVILGIFSVYNMIIARTYFASSIPYEIQEAAAIDGCSIPRMFFSIILPLSMPIICVLILYTAVGYWNSYFYAMLFLNNNDYAPLQLVLRRILLTGSAIETSKLTVAQAASSQRNLDSLAVLAKYCVIVVASAPMIIIYPFIQRYFIKGVMIGAVKG